MLNISDEQGATVLLISLSLALHSFSLGDEIGGGAHAKCAKLLLESAASLGGTTVTGVSTGLILQSLRGLGRSTGAAALADTLVEYGC